MDGLRVGRGVYMGTEEFSEPATVRHLQATLFPPMGPTFMPNGELHLPPLGTGSYLSNFLLKSGQVEGDTRSGLTVPRLKEQRDLFAISKEQTCPSLQPPRWPAECQVIDERIEHISFTPSIPEQYYTTHGNEAQPKPLGEEFGTVIYQYLPVSAINYNPLKDGQLDCDLKFESRFESGNLAKVIKLTASFYELYVRHDMYTNRHTQWFYFRIENVKKHVLYRFSIVNLSKGESLYTSGMRPLMYSTRDAKLHSIGWRRSGDNISYFCNDNGNPEEDQPSTYTLTFTIEFPHDNDTVYLAHSYPYTYSDLQDYLTTLAKHPVKSTYSSLRLLCRSLAGNNIYYVTITSPTPREIKKKAIVVTARVHPGEAPSSWMMKGLLDFLTGDTEPARELREKFIFKLVPMLNPDGVVVGNTRCSLTGRDLNRQYRTVIRETYPSIWYTKLMVRRLIDECSVAMYCDFHAHSRMNNIFIYGCENRKGYDRHLQEQVFPLMLHKNAADKFSFENCKFKIQRVKEGTGRVVMWMMGIFNSYTMEASFAGSDLGPRADTHFSIADYEHMGRVFGQTLLDFYDETPNKERLRCKIWKKLLKEGSTAEEPTNISISDYSSDEGDSSSYDEGGGEPDVFARPFAAPPSSPSSPPRVKKKVIAAPVKSNVSKSPTVARKVFPVYHATLGLSSGDSGSENETITHRYSRTKQRKILRRRKSKKTTKHYDHSDTELLEKKKYFDKNVSVLDLIPSEKLRSQSWNRYSGFPVSKVAEMKQAKHTTKQLTEVHAKLLMLRRRIWTGLDDGENQPLSWGFSNFVSGPREAEDDKIKPSSSKKGKDPNRKKVKTPDQDKGDKKAKKKSKSKLPKDEVKKTQTKKKTNGEEMEYGICDPNYVRTYVRPSLPRQKSIHKKRREEIKSGNCEPPRTYIRPGSPHQKSIHKKRSEEKMVYGICDPNYPRTYIRPCSPQQKSIHKKRSEEKIKSGSFEPHYPRTYIRPCSPQQKSSHKKRSEEKIKSGSFEPHYPRTYVRPCSPQQKSIHKKRSEEKMEYGICDPNYLRAYVRPCSPQQKSIPKKPRIKRQTAVDWTAYENRRPALKSKSLHIQEPEVARVRDRCMSNAESGDTEEQKKGKKKKRKGNGVWTKKVKSVANVNAFIRKSSKI